MFGISIFVTVKVAFVVPPDIVIVSPVTYPEPTAFTVNEVTTPSSTIVSTVNPVPLPLDVVAAPVTAV